MLHLHKPVLGLSLSLLAFSVWAENQELELETLTVTETASQQTSEKPQVINKTASTASKVPTAILETPQSVSVINFEQAKALSPISVSQALRYSVGANNERFGGFGTQLDITRIRGIDADYYLDGLRVISNVSTWTPQVDPFTLQRVEILRGPSSALYGQGTGGGVINQVSRRPQATSSHELMLQTGNFGRKFIGVDSTGAINDDQTLLYRLTMTGLDSNGQLEDVKHERFYIAPSITWKPSDATSWTWIATHSREPEIPDYNSLPAVAVGLKNSPYPKLKRHRNFSDMNFQNSWRKQNSLSSLFEHQFDNGWSFTSNTRYMYINSNIERTSIYNYQDRNGELWLEGTYGIAPARSTTFQTDNYLSKLFHTGAISHTILIGSDYAQGTMRSDSYRMDPIAFNPFDPNDYRPNAKPDFTDSMNNWPYNVRQDFTRTGIYAQDQMDYENWKLTLSARHDWSEVKDKSRSYSTVWNKSKQTDRKWSGRAGLTYVFDNGFAPYISYATSFDPVLGNNFSGSAFVPTESKQTEVGIKYQPAGSQSLITAAVYELSQTNVKTADTQHLGFWTQSGEVRSRGFELEGKTYLADQLYLQASYSYLDNTLTKDANYKNKRLTQTPRHSAATWLDYQFQGALTGLKVGAGVRYLGATYGDPQNTFKVPSATLTDAMLGFDLARFGKEFEGVELALNVNNLTNKRYVASCSSANYCFIGQDRTVLASLTWRSQ